MTLVKEIERRSKHSAATRAKARAKAATPARTGSGNVEQGYAIIVAVAMFVVNALLAYLARSQYYQETDIKLVLKDSYMAIPLFYILAYRFRPTSGFWQVFVGVLSSAIGCYLVYIFNLEGYYASMKRAPSLGTLWVWLFMEMEWYFGLASLVLVILVSWLKGFSWV